MSEANTHVASKDAISWYRDEFDNLGWEIDVDGADTLRSLYTLGMGLGMEESSGNYCVGYDTSVSNQSSTTAEAGLFQTSYNSMGVSNELKRLYDEYRNNPARCYFDTFKVGASCRAQSIVGSGSGAEYQKFNKSCPAFAAEYAMVVLRVLRKHYGPINRLEANLSPACNSMLNSVQELVQKNPVAACNELY